jgi:hypothetical protein
MVSKQGRLGMGRATVADHRGWIRLVVRTRIAVKAGRGLLRIEKVIRSGRDTSDRGPIGCKQRIGLFVAAAVTVIDADWLKMHEFLL